MELATLERVNASADARLACQAHLLGRPVSFRRVYPAFVDAEAARELVDGVRTRSGKRAVRARLITLAGVIVSLFAVMASLPASADELAFQRLAGLASVNVSANLQALRDDFAQAPSEAQRLGAGIGAALSDGTAVRAVTFVLILVIAGAGLEWLYWTFAAAPLRAIISTSAATPREAAVLALRRLGLLGFGLVLFTASTVGAALTLPWAANVDAVVIAATALVVEVRSVWMIADLVVSPHHLSLRLAPIQRYKSELVVGGVACSRFSPPRRSFCRSCC